MKTKILAPFGHVVEYKAIAETDDSYLPENFKSSTYANWEICLDQYKETKVLISNKLKALEPIAATLHSIEKSCPK